MNVRNIISILFCLILLNSCTKYLKCYSKYALEQDIYVKNNLFSSFKKYDSDLNELDHTDSIKKLIKQGYVFKNTLVEIVNSDKGNEDFLNRVRNLGGYVYCY